MCTGLSTTIHRINPNFTASFQGVPPSDPNAPCCCYLLQHPFRHTLPRQIEIINALYCIHIFFPLCVYTIHSAQTPLLVSESLNKSHFSGSCRLPTKDIPSLSDQQQYLHSKLPAGRWILEKNQAPFPTPGMSLGSHMPTCTFLHPAIDFFLKVNMYPKHTNYHRPRDVSLKYRDSVSSSRDG